MSNGELLRQNIHAASKRLNQAVDEIINIQNDLELLGETDLPEVGGKVGQVLFCQSVAGVFTANNSRIDQIWTHLFVGQPGGATPRLLLTRGLENCDAIIVNTCQHPMQIKAHWDVRESPVSRLVLPRETYHTEVDADATMWEVAVL